MVVRDEEWLWFCFFKQETAYEIRISDWSSDVCSSDLLDLWNQGPGPAVFGEGVRDLTIEDSRIRASGGLELLGDRMDVARNRIEDGPVGIREGSDTVRIDDNDLIDSRSSAIHVGGRKPAYDIRSEEHTSELQSLMRISSAVFCLNTKNTKKKTQQHHTR